MPAVAKARPQTIVTLPTPPARIPALDRPGAAPELGRRLAKPGQGCRIDPKGASSALFRRSPPERDEFQCPLADVGEGVGAFLGGGSGELASNRRKEIRLRIKNVHTIAQKFPCSLAKAPCSVKENSLFLDRVWRSRDRLGRSPRRAGAA